MLKNILIFALLAILLPAQQPRHAWKEITLDMAHAGAAVADIELTQHCLANHTCREANPLMPTSRAGAYALDFSLVGFAAYASHRLHKQHNRWWWTSPAAGIAAHGAGVGTGIAAER